MPPARLLHHLPFATANTQSHGDRRAGRRAMSLEPLPHGFGDFSFTMDAPPAAFWSAPPPPPPQQPQDLRCYPVSSPWSFFPCTLLVGSLSSDRNSLACLIQPPHFHLGSKDLIYTPTIFLSCKLILRGHVQWLYLSDTK
jgi:hypothetical protein